MLPKAFLAAALATSTASAFLLPSTVDVPQRGDDAHHRHHANAKEIDAAAGDETSSNADGLVLVSPFYHDRTKVNVPCPGCSMQVRTRGNKHHKHHKEEEKETSEKEETKETKEASEKQEEAKDGSKIITITDLPNHIELFFSIDHATSRDRLLVNNFELYPDVDVYESVLTAAQVPDVGFHPHHAHHDEEHREHHEHHEEHDQEHDHEEPEEHDEEKENSELKKKLRRHRKGPVDEAKTAEVKHHKGHKWSGQEESKDGEFPQPHGKHSKHGKHGKHGKPFVQVPLGYSVEVNKVGEDSSNGMEVILITLQIVQVNNVFVQDIPAVHVRVIHTAEGGLMFARIDVDGQEESDSKNANELAVPVPHHGHHGKGAAKARLNALKEELDQCTNVLCRWKAIIKASVKSHHGGCMGKAMGKKEQDGDDVHYHHAHGHHDKPSDSKHDDDHEEEEGKPFGHFHHELHEHSWGKLFQKLASHVLLPILAGIIAGIVASAVGMVVGTIIVSVWRLLFRRGGQAGATRRHRHSRSRNLSSGKAALRHADEQAVDEEKAGLMAAAEEEPEIETTTVDAMAAPAAAAPVQQTPSDAELPPYQDNDSKSASA